MREPAASRIVLGLSLCGQTLRDRVLSIALLVAAACLLTVNLGHYGLWDPDEGRHAEIARELFTASSWRGWLLPTRNFMPYHDKPILYYWLTSIAYAVVGINELGARLVSALAALGTLAALHAWTARVWDPRTARAAVGVLVTAGGFLGLGRYGNLDMLLTCWITLGLLAAYRFTEDPRRTGVLAAAALAAALGMLTKGLAAPLFIVAIPLAHAWLTRRRLPRRPGLYAGAMLLFVLVAAPWYVAAGVLDPSYLHDFFLVHHLARFAERTTTFHAQPWWFYGPAILLVFFPWSFLLPATVAAAFGRPQRDEAGLFCLCWAGVVIGFFTCSHGKLATYVLPALPPLAALTARLLTRIADGIPAPRNVRRLVVGGLATMCVVLVALLPALVWLGRERFGTVLERDGMVLLVLPLTSAVVLTLWRRRGPERAALGLGACTALGFLLFYARVAPTMSSIVSEAGLAAVIDSRQPAPIVTYNVQASSLIFYVGRPVVHLNRPKALRNLLAEHPFAWIVTSPRHLEEIARAAPVFPWRTGGKHVLYATEPPNPLNATRPGAEEPS